MGTDKLVIRKQHHPWRRLALAGLVFAVVAGAVVGAYRLGVDRGVGEAAAAVRERQSLRQRLATMSEELAALRGEVARLQSAQRIDREAHDKVRANLGRVQQQNLELREELQFYRNIVAPSENSAGVQVQRFLVEPAIGPGQFRYKLTLIHLRGAKSRKDVARGRVEVYIDGSAGDRKQRLRLAELVESAELTYSIKYFKHFEGELRLPEGFQPHSAVVEVIPRGDDRPVLEKRIRWPGTASG